MITSPFKTRFIEYYGAAIYEFIENNYKKWIEYAEVPSASLHVDSVSKQRLNNAIKDYIQQLGYEFKQVTIKHIADQQVRCHVFYKNHNRNESFEQLRSLYMERFLSNYDFLLHGPKTHTIFINRLLADYEYWFKYRKISMLYSYNEATILHNVIEWLRTRGAVVAIGAKKIIIQNY